MLKTHHSCSPASLQASQPRHVDGRARATVCVRCGAMKSGKVVSCMDNQEVVATNTADRVAFGVKFYDDIIFIYFLQS